MVVMSMYTGGKSKTMTTNELRQRKHEQETRLKPRTVTLMKSILGSNVDILLRCDFIDSILSSCFETCFGFDSV